MYKNGEIQKIMDQFERDLGAMPVYVAGSKERAEMAEVETESGVISKRYANNNYYNNGQVNQMFIMYMTGYSLGKAFQP